MIATMASPPILGTKDHLKITQEALKNKVEEASEDDLVQMNEASQSRFIIDASANPHPRFPGLMTSIRERRSEKVTILAPLY